MRNVLGIVLSSLFVVSVVGQNAEYRRLLQPKAVVPIRLDVPHKNPNNPKFNKEISLVAAEGTSSESASEELCMKLQEALKDYQIQEFSGNCIPRLRNLVERKRGKLLQAGPKTLRVITSMRTSLENMKLSLPGGRQLENLAETPSKLSFLSNFIKENPEYQKICIAGFNSGQVAGAFLALNPKSEVHAFDAGTAPEVVPGHDYLDPKYPNRLTLYVGDPPLTIARFVQLNEGFKCDVVYVDASMSVDSTRSSLLDFRPIANHQTGHAVFINFPKQQVKAASEQIKTLMQYGAINVDSVVQEDPGSDPFINELWIATYPS